MPFKFEQLAFRIDGRDLLAPLTLDLPRGQVIGLIGQNGSGKSTLVKLMARQLEPSSGRVLFEDRAVASLSRKHFARQVAYLPQSPTPVTGLLVREFIALGRYPWHGALGRFSAEDAGAVREAIALTGVSVFENRLVETLSGGERQKVWLAMLIAQKSGCLLLDEPISALDVAHQVEVMDFIRDMSERRGLTTLIVLHDINMAARYCGHIVALREGRLVFTGAPSELMQPHMLASIYGVRMGVMAHPGSGAPISYLH